MLLASAPATSAARYCASVNPALCFLVRLRATVCAYARCVPPRTGGIVPALNSGACGAAALAFALPLGVCVVAVVATPLVLACGAGAARLAPLGGVAVSLVAML